MSDTPAKSIEEILAACRQTDGETSPPPSDPSGGGDETPVETPSPPAEPPASTPPSAAKDAGSMSMAEMLAAARAEKGGGSKAAPAKPTESAPAAAAPPKDAGKMTVEEMLAAARGEKSAPAKASPKPAAATLTKPAKTDKSAQNQVGPKPSGPKDTASILAAARRSAKPGPISKSEAAARGGRDGQTTTKPAKPAKQKLVVPPMPEKPAYATAPQPAPTAEERQDRRWFLTKASSILVGSSLAIGFSTLLVTHILWLLGFARFMFPNILTEPPMKFKAGFPDSLSPGQVETKYKALYGVWIVSYEYEGQPEIYALKSVCTHLGCTPNWLEGEQKFKCPCHGSGFYKDGINFEGPAPRPLERYAISLAPDGQLQVDKSRTFLEEKGQWKDPACFVPV